MINALSTSLDLEQKARQVDKQELCFGVRPTNRPNYECSLTGLKEALQIIPSTDKLDKPANLSSHFVIDSLTALQNNHGPKNKRTSGQSM